MKTDDNCPCIDCVPPKRTPDCHAKCREYAEYSDNNEKKKQAKHESIMVDVYLASRKKHIRKRRK
jgi:hypothetical protein